MARPVRTGLNYSSLDTTFMSDRKLQRLSLKYDCRGITVYLAILCEIYQTYGYFVTYTDEFCQNIGFTLHLEEAMVDEIVRFCVEIHLFDGTLLANRHVLTSKGVQNRFREIGGRKKKKARYQPVIKSDVSKKTSTGNGITYNEYLVLKQQKQQSHDNK